MAFRRWIKLILGSAPLGPRVSQPLGKKIGQSVRKIDESSGKP